MTPKYPVYIVSKGRWETRLTAKSLEKMRVPYQIVIEPQEYDDYAAVIDPAKILVLPFSNLGQGSIPARNWIWDHSIREYDADRHWILDDNIRGFYRLHKNRKTPVHDGVPFCATEDFVDRHENIGLAGLQYFMFAPRKAGYFAPYMLNTRIYSCILIWNDLPMRWRGRYNEDTDLSLRVLKEGWVTVLMYAFLANKMPTLSMKGGNTESLYKLDNEDGRWLMAESLRKQHPKEVTVGRRWNRWQHFVDYRKFRDLKPILKSGMTIDETPNEYGLALKFGEGIGSTRESDEREEIEA